MIPSRFLAAFGAALMLTFSVPVLARPLQGDDLSKAESRQTVELVLHFASDAPVTAITLLDNDGKPVYEGQPVGDELRVSGLQPGLYVAWMKVGHRVVTRKVRVG